MQQQWTTEEAQSALFVQSSIALLAIEALIANHPEPHKVKATFDQMYGQLQAGAITTGAANLSALNHSRAVVGKLFSRVP